jgi:hypothetical protein
MRSAGSGSDATEKARLRKIIAEWKGRILSHSRDINKQADANDQLPDPEDLDVWNDGEKFAYAVGIRDALAASAKQLEEET